MTRFVLIMVVLLITSITTKLFAEPASTQDQYLQIYLYIQESDKLEASGQKATAREHYKIAVDRLKKLRSDNSDWEPTIVNYRINYCQNKVDALKDAKDSVKTPTTTSGTSASVKTSGTGQYTTPPPVTNAADDPTAIKKQISDLQTKLTNTTNQLTQAKAEATALKSKVASLEASLKAAKDLPPDSKTSALMEENKKLNEKLAAAQASIGSLQSGTEANSLVNLQEQLKKVQDQLTAAKKENESLQQSSNNYKARLAETQKNLDAANAKLAASSADPALQKENTMLRDILQRELAEQARREITKRMAMEELQNLSVNSDKLKTQIDLLGAPLVQLTNEEKALFKGPGDTQQLTATSSESGSAAVVTITPSATTAVATTNSDTTTTVNSATTTTSSTTPTLVVANTGSNPNLDNTLIAKRNDLTNTGSIAPINTPDYSVQAKVPPEFKDSAKQANELFNKQKFNEAAAQYQSMLDKYPDSLYALSNLGVVRFQQQKYADAEKYLRQAANQASNDPFSHSMLGIALYQQGKYDEAVQVLTRAVALSPNDPKTHNYLGISASQKGWQEAAEQECRKATELDPQYGDAYFNLAVIYATQRPPARELAKRNYERALELGIPRDTQLEKLIYAKDTNTANATVR